MKACFPDWHSDGNIRNKEQAEAYAVKSEVGKWKGGAKEEEARPGGTERSRNKWLEILVLAETGKFEELKNPFPGKHLRYLSVLMNAAAQERVTRMVGEEVCQIDLKKKNMHICGDPGSGKTWLAGKKCGPRAYLKSHPKWFDGLTERTTGLVWNDPQEMTSRR
jgi:hypothetical protein